MKHALGIILFSVFLCAVMSGCQRLEQNNAVLEHDWKRIRSRGDHIVEDRCAECDEKRLYADADCNVDLALLIGVEAECIFDWNRDPLCHNDTPIEIVQDAYDNVVFTLDKKRTVYANGEPIMYQVLQFFLADLNSDGYDELCFSISVGSGICDRRIVIVDYKSNVDSYSLSNRGLYDYQLYLRDGILCVQETKYMKEERVRTGILTYTETGIEVVWDYAARRGDCVDYCVTGILDSNG